MLFWTDWVGLLALIADSSFLLMWNLGTNCNGLSSKLLATQEHLPGLWLWSSGSYRNLDSEPTNGIVYLSDS